MTRELWRVRVRDEVENSREAISNSKRQSISKSLQLSRALFIFSH
jgi:hypothetical protein